MPVDHCLSSDPKAIDHVDSVPIISPLSAQRNDMRAVPAISAAGPFVPNLAVPLIDGVPRSDYNKMRDAGSVPGVVGGAGDATPSGCGLQAAT